MENYAVVSSFKHATRQMTERKFNKTAVAKSWWKMNESQSTCAMYTLFVSRTSRSLFNARRTKNANKNRTPEWNTSSRLWYFFLLNSHSQVNAAGVIARSAVADLHTFKKAHKVSPQSARESESRQIVYTLLHLKINKYERARPMSRSLFYLVSFHIFFVCVVLRSARSRIGMKGYEETKRWCHSNGNGT